MVIHSKNLKKDANHAAFSSAGSHLLEETLGSQPFCKNGKIPKTTIFVWMRTM